MQSVLCNRLERVAAFLLLLLPFSAFGEEKPVEMREHRVVIVGSKSVGEYSSVVRVSPVGDHTFLLFRSNSGDELVLEGGLDCEKQSAEYLIRDLKGTSWIRIRSHLSFTSGTCEETLKEASQNPELMDSYPHRELETNGGRWVVTEKDWVNGQLTSQLRHSVSFELLEMIDRATSTILASSRMALWVNGITKYLFYHSGCPASPVETPLAVPSCGFDKSFGFPCGPKQQARVEEAIKTQTKGATY
ncbi:MAG TPA: hypothetical protein VHL58_02790 [Thermoanaerobaculia bacterium]|nr:hypothetical protein [Thermoanaerobaculia bacterium]